jgi:hypothetical protein
MPAPIPYEAMMRLILPSILVLIAFSGVAAQPDTTTISSSGGTSSHDQPSSGTNSQTGSAIVEVITEPDIGTGTLRFTGTPEGLISLSLGQQEQLVADNLVAGSYTSTLAAISSALAVQGYRLESIACDDEESPSPSTGNMSTQTATFNIEDGETVTCRFKLVDSACLCPREGSWTVTNLPGVMACTGAFNMSIPLPPGTETGTLEIRDGCQTLFATDFSDDTADLTMHRVAGCAYEGTVGGSQDGIPMVIHFTWHVQNEEFITGNLHSQVNQSGATCTMSRPFEMRFNN